MSLKPSYTYRSCLLLSEPNKSQMQPKAAETLKSESLKPIARFWLSRPSAPEPSTINPYNPALPRSLHGSYKTLRILQSPLWEFPEIRVPYSGFLITRILLFKGTVLGSPIFGSSHIKRLQQGPRHVLERRAVIVLHRQLMADF